MDPKMMAACAFIALVGVIWWTLVEVVKTLRAYRELQPRVVLLLENAKRISVNVEEITRQVTVQTTRLDHMTEEAKDVVEKVQKTVDLYNKTVARPAIMLASLTSGVRGAASFFFRKSK